MNDESISIFFAMVDNLKHEMGILYNASGSPQFQVKQTSNQADEYKLVAANDQFVDFTNSIYGIDLNVMHLVDLMKWEM